MTSANQPPGIKVGPASEFVSVVIPCYNEERFIVKALDQLVNQYDPESYEIVVVDGLSNDSTRQRIEEFKRDHPQLSITVVDNPARNIPVALNLGVRNSRGSIIARMDAHAVPPPGYVRRCVEVLEQPNVGAVGMPCLVRPGAETLTARAIASAVSHPFGIGDAKYRLTETESGQESVDTVAFACFRKALWEELGGFNEQLLTNEDYDFNYRIRQTGKQVILDRQGHCDYFARSTLKGLSQQYRRYGHWKAQMVKLHPRSIKLRHLVAPVFVLSILFLLILGLLYRPFWLLLVLVLVMYSSLALYFGWKIARKSEAGVALVALMPLVFLLIHLSWGSSFLIGVLMPSSKAY
jgi:succinoglycan biosynthesis protein ExoA